MPTFEIENSSPLIQYLPAASWREGSKSEDPEASRYSGDSSFTVTEDPGATVQFNFTGTSIFVGGAKRINHGSYSVTLDGRTSRYSGFSGFPEQFQTALFQADGLAPGDHTILITNEPQREKRFLDIDFIRWASHSADASVPLPVDSTVTTLKDTEFSYEPEDAWFTDVTALPGFLNNTGHSTVQEGAKVTINFEGTGISLFSAVGPSQAPYSASLDGGPSTSYDTVKTDYYPDQMIYHADRLSPGQHFLELVRLPTGRYFAVDYALIYDTDYGEQKHSGLSPGAIAGVVMSVFILIALTATAVFILIKRRSHIHRAKNWRAGYAARAANIPEEQHRPPRPQGQSHERISAWRQQTLAATMDVPTTQIGGGRPASMASGADTHQKGPGFTSNFHDAPHLGAGDHHSTAATSLFSAFRQKQSRDEADRFGQKVRNGKTFVDLA